MNKPTLFKRIKSILFVLLLIVLVFVTIFPFLWMISASLKFDTQVFTNPIKWIPDPFNWQNYVNVWTKVPFLNYYKNTAIVAVCGTALQVAVCSLAAYAFAKLKFRGSQVLFFLFLATMMVPWHTIMIPQYILMGTLKMIDRHITLILMQGFSAFGIFLMRQFFMGLPDDLREAAKIDGANEFRIFLNILLPQTKAGLSTLAIFTFIGQWNDYISPLMYINSDEKFTLQLGLTRFAGQHTTQYALTMAGTICAMLPIFIVYMIFEKQITQGVAFTGIKG